jgi:hypothetical protein
MLPMQKQAWFNLTVVCVTLVTIAALVPFLGRGALGGFGVLGLLGFNGLFARKRTAMVAFDERDHMIQRKSALIGYSVFWVVFVLAVTIVSLRYSDRGAVPIVFVESSVFCGLMILIATMSVATLVQYGRK